MIFQEMVCSGKIGGKEVYPEKSAIDKCLHQDTSEPNWFQSINPILTPLKHS